MRPSVDNFLSFVFGNLFVAFSHIGIDEENSDRLVIDDNTRKLIVDRRKRTVSAFGHMLARFDAVDSIQVAHFINGRRYEWWILSLQLRDGRKVQMGKSTDGPGVAIVAAHLSTVIDKRVLAISKPGI
jgi:5-carboxymethyl-2-hydroxymuconate isomerase